MSNAQHEGVTVRSFLIGTLVSLLIGLGIAYADNAIRGSYMAFDFGSPVAVFFLFVIVALLNPLAGWIRRAWFLSEAEITLVFIMALVAASIPAMGLTGFFLPYLSGAQYYASPENGWAELFMHYTPDWLIVQDQQAIKNFYEGNPQGASDIPWKAWLPSLMAWLPFLLTLYLVMIASMVILRRQWMTHERLLYPLMQPSLALIAQEKGRLLPPLLRSALFWFGVGIPFTIGSITALHAYYPFFPKIELYTLLPIFRDSTLLRPGLYFTTIGFTYFLSRDISLGIWFFNLLAKLQEGSFNILGVSSNEYMEWVTVPILAHQNIGAMIVFVLFGLWMGRSHLRAVVRKAFRGDASVQDADEMMSYRTAVFLVLGGSGFMMWWLWMSGLALWATGMVLFIAFVLFLGLTRMVTEGGFFTTRAPMNPGNFMVSGFGAETLGASGVTALGYTFVWAGELRVFVMAACANALMMAEKIRGRRKILLWAMLVAILVSALGSIWVEMALGYRYGGINLSGFFTGLVHYPFRFIARNLANPTGPHWGGWLWTAYGGVLMGGLMLARQRLSWWPIHPMSLPISSMWMTDSIMLSVFLSWLIKGVILKYGGRRLYDRGKPFFIGLVIGQFACMGCWLIIDYFTGMTGNVVYRLSGD